MIMKRSRADACVRSLGIDCAVSGSPLDPAILSVDRRVIAMSLVLTSWQADLTQRYGSS